MQDHAEICWFGVAITAATSVGFAPQVLKQEPRSIHYGSVFPSG
jgi:hypothetical protein